MFSIIIKQIALSSFTNNRISVIHHGNGVSARANRNEMGSASFMKVDEVAQELGVSKSYAYKIVQKLNAELAEKGYMVISGRVNKQYFTERTCYGADKKER